MKPHKLLLGKLLMWLFDDTVSVGVLAIIIPTLARGVSEPYGSYKIFQQNFEPDSSRMQACIVTASSRAIYRMSLLLFYPITRCILHSDRYVTADSTPLAAIPICRGSAFIRLGRCTAVNVVLVLGVPCTLTARERGRAGLATAYGGNKEGKCKQSGCTTQLDL
jgi:hypothetical protein